MQFLSRLFVYSVMMDNNYAIAVEDLRKTYTPRRKPAVHALKGISFQVERGTIFGLLGPNGAGKSTTIKIITTLTAPTSGTATVNGFDCVKQPLDTRRSLAVVLQQNAFELYLTVLGNLRTYARFQHIPGTEAGKRISEVIDQFGLYDERHTHAIDLSGGMRRRLQVAKAFLSRKPVVILDEATTGLDPINRRTTLEAIRQQASKGTTVVLTTHLLDEAEELCDRLVIIDHGRIIAEGEVAEIKRLGVPAYRMNLIFRDLTPETLHYLRDQKPLHLKYDMSTVDITLQRSHQEILDLIKDLDRRFELIHFEVRSADLEDVFIDLLSRLQGEER
jgi:ABC-2 type transport system ATP-binding protein